MDKVFLTMQDQTGRLSDIMEAKTPLLAKIEDHTAMIGIVGLGYVGLTLALGLTEKGYSVVGVDSSTKHLEDILDRSSFVKDEPGLTEALHRAIRGDKLRLAGSLDPMCDILIVCVPVDAFGNAKIPDLRHLLDALAQIALVLDNAPSPRLVLIESTLPISIFNSIVVPFLLRHCNKKVAGKDFYIAYCPERVSIGTLLHDLNTRPRVIGAVSEQCEGGPLAKALYSKLTAGDIDITTAANAEFTKLAEATIRYVNVTLANALALISSTTATDIWTVRKLVNKVQLWDFHRPGPGVGGHCISKDAGFMLSDTLIPLANTLWETLENINRSVIAKLVKMLFSSTSTAEGRIRIVVLGRAYKANVTSAKNSGTDKLLEYLRDDQMFSVVIHDPMDFEGLSVEEIAIDSHAIVLMTDHEAYREINWKAVAQVSKRAVLIDARGMFADAPPEDVEYYCLGQGNV